MNLKSLVHRELSEGLTEEELASRVGVPAPTIADILMDKLPQEAPTWESFSRYFRLDPHLLRAGGPPLPDGVFYLTDSSPSRSGGRMRKVPLLNYHQVNQIVAGHDRPRVVHAEAMLETDVPGKRTFAVMVYDNSMHPLFREGDIIFVNPDLPSKPDDYVVVESEDGHPERAIVRQLKQIGGRCVLHPLNRRYEDLPITKQCRIWGRVVRLRKNL